jgi:aminopeptidase
MKLDNFDKFIDLILSTGIEMKKDQCIYISYDAALAEHVEDIAVEAYKRGAKYVWFDPKYMRAQRSRLDHTSLENCDFIPAFAKGIYDEAAQSPWARVHIDGKGDPHLFSGVNAEKSLRADKKGREVMANFRKSIIRGDIPWSISCLPTPKWAALVMGTPEGEETTKAFWKILSKILRLDNPNPAETWRKLSDKLISRADTLNTKKFKKLTFEAPGTQLEVELIQESHWQGGSHTNTSKGFRYLANIPTEEVFTSPDWRKTQGRARMTRPVEVMNQIIEGAEFEFKDGKCVNFSAQKGGAALEGFFKSCEQAQYLGEIALVDGSSPIYQSGKTFYSILLDENAACHMAFGSAYPLGVEDRNLSPEELKKLGFNVSIQHTDFMIGCPEMTIHGVHADGRSEAIMKSGTFTNEYT